MVLRTVALILLLSYAALAPLGVRADQASRTTPLVSAVEKAAPAVVNISTTVQDSRQNFFFSTGDPVIDEMFRNMFPPSNRQRGSLGTGVVIDGARGLIVTNSHVVRAAEKITVQLSDKREFSARLLGADAGNDIAVLKVDSQLPQALLGDSDDIMIAEQVVAIGNPYGFSHTVTVGVVSALKRRVKTGPDTYLSGLIQTDASINPGNSGGPLINIDGEVIGINTMIHRAAQGIGFAIPINKVQRVVEALGRTSRAAVWLGLIVEDVTDSLPADIGQESCLKVVKVLPDSPANKAGIKAGDMLLALDGWTGLSLADYQLALKTLNPNQQVLLTVYNERKTQWVTALLAEKFALPQALALWEAQTGLRLANAGNNGLEVLQVKDPAAALGLRPGDYVMKVENTDLAAISDLGPALADKQGGGPIKALLRRNNVMRWLTF